MELEREHRDQCMLVQKLQEKVQKAMKYEEASRTQQEVLVCVWIHGV